MSAHSLLCERIAVAKELIKRAEALCRSQKGGIEGGSKLCSRLKAELKFLHKVEAGKVAIKESHLQSTNLTHLQAIIESAENLEEVAAVLHVFNYEDKYATEAVISSLRRKSCLSRQLRREKKVSSRCWKSS
ncbi:UPF0415 protein C7orf25 homolog [Sceloporus undulatus]|uniref:UPF0415 protein C7orf25 homolog n=1 Tax=Sceloporus undulatus TaxID=8520 RepID=UPI001C4BF9AE|nr:UPF0415 protein C7orf25 homolog [Sceloporus undulatus]